MTEPHEPNDTPPPRSGLWPHVLARVIRIGIFLVWYVLSIGPMFWIWHHASNASEPSLVEAFYRPLAVACDLSPALREVVNKYIDLWIL